MIQTPTHITKIDVADTQGNVLLKGSTLRFIPRGDGTDATARIGMYVHLENGTPRCIYRINKTNTIEL